MWLPIETNPLPKKDHVIGINKYPHNNDTGVICGVKYDLNDQCVIDLQRDRWMRITHWMYPPKDD